MPASSRLLRRLTVAFLGLSFLVLVPGCDSNEDEQPARVRVVYADATTAASSVYIDFDLLARDLSFGDASSYVAWEPGLSLIEVRTKEDGLEVPLVSREVVLEEDRDYTIVVAGTDAPASIFLLEDDRSTIAFTRARLRVVNGAGRTGAVNVFVAPDGSGSSALVFSALPFGMASEHVTLDEGTYDFTVDATDGSASTDLLDQRIQERRLYLFLIANTGTGDRLTNLLVVDG